MSQTEKLLQLPAEWEALLAQWERATPLEALGELTEELVVIGAQEFRMLRPAEPDRLLEHPAILTAFGQDEYMPYWCDLWPASRMLAKAVLQSAWSTGTRMLELGCGLGLAGIAALRQGIQLTFSDYDGTALRCAAANALRNDCPNFSLLPLNWYAPPQNVAFPVILGADLLYEKRSVAPVVALLEKMLEPGGTAWITDQDRPPADWWRTTLQERGFAYHMKPMHAGHPAGPGQVARRAKGTLYVIGRS
jgi:predicted nicotinamide N-methyase